VADVVPVTLDVSEDALMFTFSLDNWDDHVEMVSTCQATVAIERERERYSRAPCATLLHNPLPGAGKH
jgi:hypothetical protein